MYFTKVISMTLVARRKKKSYNHLRYLDIVNFYRMVILSFDGHINCHEPKNLLHNMVVGIYDFNLRILRDTYLRYLDN